MEDNILHITNGDSFTNRLQNLTPSSSILTWNEMLCEGPTIFDVGSQSFIQERIDFLRPYGATTEKYKHFIDQFSLLDSQKHQEIYLWFEYDLFCHVNLSAVITLLQKKNNTLPIYLICSGKISSDDCLYALNELTDVQLNAEIEKKVLLSTSEKSALLNFWEVYCGNDPRKFHDILIPKTSLPYLTNCITVHLERFPSISNGLNKLESMVLQHISEKKYTSKRELIGQLLKNQDYYGFGDLQWATIIENLKSYIEVGEFLTISEEGKSILSSDNQKRYVGDLPVLFGGTKKYDYLYNNQSERIEKA